ncbi:sulfatase family protein [Rubritalea tangerina]|uniref:Arylsulfatase n=1 Tax=Rubritalea tangerina TaxID=430798 RepID=A0ABW4Z6A9_9BACT
MKKWMSMGIGMLMMGMVGAEERPNIVVILADDLGWGDVKSNYAGSKIETPHMDGIAREGVRFVDAHSNSSVCTPTRYGVLTGRYAWRTRLKRGVLMGYSPALIEEGRETVASVLKDAGYRTACIGKWHLGMNIQKTDGKWDFGKEIERGPRSVGFDYFLGISASLDMAPYALIENERFIQNPTESFKAVNDPLAYRRGGAIAPEFKHEDYLPLVSDQAKRFISEASEGEQPFFLYLPLPSPHKPVLPSKGFRGKSGIGAYGDFVVETDWVIGQVVGQLKASGVYKDTLLIVTSDNASFAIPEKYGAVQSGHKPNAGFRGQKTDAYEGGHRVPFLCSWPARGVQGKVSDQVVCTTDIMPTALAAAGVELPKGAAEDGYNMLPEITGAESLAPIREATVHHSASGMFAIRKGKWKLICGRGSGGRTKVAKDAPKIQLYDMQTDPSESKNLYQEHPEIVKELESLLDRYKQQGYSNAR